MSTVAVSKSAGINLGALRDPALLIPLVGAGVLSVLIYPSLALAIDRSAAEG